MLSKRFRLSIVLALTLAAGSAACDKKDDKAPVEEAVSQPAQQAPEQQEEPEEPAKMEMKPHTSAVPGTMNQLEWDQDVPDVVLEIVSPTEGEVLPAGEDVSTSFSLTNYRTGKEIGQHVHVIVDNEPYIAHYNASEPLILKDLAPGTHTLRVFPARHYHLSLKKGEVFKTRIFHVGEKSADFKFDPEKPYVTYSRPKGTYTTDAAEELLLDFYVSNVELGTDAKVVYAVDGKETELTEWKPVLLEPLSPGEHEITLKLVDMEGNVIENGGFNNTTRTITVKE
jgi:hypothetical protein